MGKVFIFEEEDLIDLMEITLANGECIHNDYIKSGLMCDEKELIKKILEDNSDKYTEK